MKRFPPVAGKIGVGLIALGVLSAAASLVVPSPPGMPLPILLIVGAFLYLSGGILAVGAYNYTKGSRLFLASRVSRVIFALIVVYSFIRAMQN
jgi:hypothetical protein